MSDCGAAKVISRGNSRTSFGNVADSSASKQAVSELLGIRSYSADACSAFALLRMIRPG
jgi:hypothetical protein